MRITSQLREKTKGPNKNNQSAEGENQGSNKNIQSRLREKTKGPNKNNKSAEGENQRA